MKRPRSIFYGRLVGVMNGLATQYRFLVYFINNASTDATLSKILAWRVKDPRVQVITHSRNFGYQASVVSGLTHAQGEAFVVIDVDCEDPPEMIATFVRHWKEGHDVVYGLRTLRPEPKTILAARRLFYRLTHLIADWDFIVDMAEFSLFSDRVRRQVLRHHSTFPFVRSDLGYVGFRRLGIPYRREPRRYGKTHYNIVRMSRFAIGGILTTSTFLLRAIAYVGLPLALLNFISAVLAIGGIAYSYDAIWPLNAAFVAMTLSILAVYTARIVKDVIHRPIYIIDMEFTHLNHAIGDDGEQ